MSVTLNQGLKPYQESITQEIGSLKTIVNLCPSASNILVEIPLFNTFGVSVMTPSLIYNYQLSGISYGVSKGISTKLASSKISKIIRTSGKNSKINANLAKNNFGDMKVGNAGIKNITKELYRRLGYENMQDGISYVLDFGMGVIFSIC